MISPRAVALQGLGYGALFVALQGFVPLPVTSPAAQDSGGGVAPAAGAQKDQREAFAAKGVEDRRRQDEANARGKALKAAQRQAALEQARSDALQRDQERIRALIATERLRTTLAELKALAEPPKAQKTALARVVFDAFAVPEEAAALSAARAAVAVPKRDHGLPAPALVSAEMALKTAVLWSKAAISAGFSAPLQVFLSATATLSEKASQPSQALALDLRNDNRRRALLALLLLNS